MPADPCVLVILGASGDLTHRKLIPAMFEMAQQGKLPKQTRILGVSRSPKSDEIWRDELKPWVQKQVKRFDEEVWKDLSSRIHYYGGDATSEACYPGLRDRLTALTEAAKIPANVLFFMSVAPELYEPIVSRIDEAGLVTEGRTWCSVDPHLRSWQRIIVEKPFGSDAESAASLNRALGRAFEEDGIYRIDHYLGKEVVQSLLAFRFANNIFEPVWNHQFIDHVQITAAETVGVGQRIAFYDATGAIRDMIQSHLMQILAFIAMEPPNDFSAGHIRLEKIKAVDAVQVPPANRITEFGAFGQYAADATEAAYHETKGVQPDTRTETFAALKLVLDNWRWAGTPFYLRTGKKLAKKTTEVVIQFKPPAANLFRGVLAEAPAGNRMVIEIAPRERFRLRFESKVPGQGMKLAPVEMVMDYSQEFKSEPVEAYGPLIIDAMRGDQTLFKHRFEVEGAWRAMMPFLGPESEPLRRSIHANYKPGEWGPKASVELLARDRRSWYDE